MENLPDIDWSNSSITGNNYCIQINTAFVNVVHDICAEQVVTFPTRLESTLDIFITNRPTLVSKCTSIPGLSDHDIVLTDTNTIPLRQKPPKRLVYLWKKSDISGMEDNLHQFAKAFTSEFSVDTPINSLWTSFKTKSLSSISKHVPSKMTSSRYSQSWCNRTVRRLFRRKHRAFRKARQNNNGKNWTRYNNIQKACKDECKKAYND